MGKILGLFLFFTLCCEGTSYNTNRVIFLLTQGEVVAAIDLYKEIQNETGKHQDALLKQMALQIIDQAFKSKEPEDQLMAIFGAGIGGNTEAHYLLEEGMNSSFPQIQVVSLNFLGKTEDDRACEIINRAIASPYPIIRLEAAFLLAQKKHRKATAQVEALMHKMPVQILPVFPKMLAVIGDENAMKILKKLLSHPSFDVRCAAIQAACIAGRDDFIPAIRKLALQHDPRQQEAALIALALFEDHASLDVAKKLTASSYPAVKLAAHYAQVKLGEKEALKEIEAMAMEEDVFAIQILKDFKESAPVLEKLVQSSSIHTRVNATVALLHQKNRHALLGLREILIKDARDLAFAEISSPAKMLSAWKVVPSASHQGDEQSKVLHELSLGFREEVLEKTLELSEKDFLLVANVLFNTKQNDLVPHLVDLLINLDTEEVVELLKEQEQKAGAPLIRNYSALALVKMDEEGSYLNHLKEWVTQQNTVDMMKFRAIVPFELREDHSHFELTPEESARLLVEVLETLIEHEDNRGIDLLLEVLRNGNPRNRPVVAGLLLNAA